MYSMITDQDNIPLNEFSDRMRVLSDVMQNELGVNIDFAEVLGLGEFEENVADMTATIERTFNEALEGVEIEGEIGGEKLEKSVEELIDSLDFDELSVDQLETLNEVMASAGDQATDFTTRLLAINEAGALPEVLDNISASLSNQRGELQSVSGAIAQYQQDLAGLNPTARSTHESLSGIFDEFEEAVTRGDISNDVVRR